MPPSCGRPQWGHAVLGLVQGKGDLLGAVPGRLHGLLLLSGGLSVRTHTLMGPVLRDGTTLDTPAQAGNKPDANASVVLQT